MEKKTTMPVLDPLKDDAEKLTAEQKLRTALFLCIKDKGNIEELHKVFPPSLYYEFKRYIKLFLTDTYKRIHGDIEPTIPAICDKVVSDWKIAGKNRTDEEKAAIDSMEALKARYSQIPEDQPQQEELPDILNTKLAREAFGKAIERGWMEKSSNGYKWLGFDGKAELAKLAYFCGKIYGYKHLSKNNQNTAGLPWHDLEDLFKVKNLQSSNYGVYERTKIQSWRNIVDVFFKDLK